MSRLFVFLFLFCISTFYSLKAETAIPCSPQLKHLITAIQKVPEARQLIQRIQQEGPFSIVVNNDASLSQAFGAYWDPFHRIITVAHSPKIPEGIVIGSILFELHNASVDAKFEKLDELAIKRQISKSQYIEAMEYLEYVNSHNAAKIAEIGISMGLFPKESRLPTYKTFNEHFYMQKISGHSDCFGRNFDLLFN